MRFPCDRQTFGKGLFYFYVYSFICLDTKRTKKSRLKTFTLQIEPRLKSLNLRGLDIGFLIQYCSRASDRKLLAHYCLFFIGFAEP